MLLMREWMASQFWMVHYGHCYAYSLWATATECTPAETRVIMSNQWSFQLPIGSSPPGSSAGYVCFSLRLLLPLSWSTSLPYSQTTGSSPVPPVHLSIGPIWVRGTLMGYVTVTDMWARQKMVTRRRKGTWVSLPLCKETFTSPNCGLQLWWHQNDFNMGPIYGSLNSVFLNWFFFLYNSVKEAQFFIILLPWKLKQNHQYIRALE